MVLTVKISDSDICTYYITTSKPTSEFVSIIIILCYKLRSLARGINDFTFSSLLPPSWPPSWLKCPMRGCDHPKLFRERSGLKKHMENKEKHTEMTSDERKDAIRGKFPEAKEKDARYLIG